MKHFREFQVISHGMMVSSSIHFSAEFDLFFKFIKYFASHWTATLQGRKTLIAKVISVYNCPHYLSGKTEIEREVSIRYS